MDRGRGLVGLLPLFPDRSLELDPLFRPGRHRRQYADEPGSRSACRAGLVRPSSVQAESALRCEHPLVAVGRLPIAGIILALRPLVGGVDAERAAIAIAPMLPLLLLLFSLALTVRRLVDRRAYPLVVRRLVLRRLGDGHVRASADRSPRLAARIALARGRRDCGPEARSRRRRHRHRLGDVAVDRPRNADLHRDRRSGDGLVLDYRSGRTEAGLGLCGEPGRRHGSRFPRLRLLRQPPSRLRCFVAGLAFRRLAGFGLAVRPGVALARELEDAPWAGPHRRVSSWRPSMPWRGRNACRASKASRPKSTTFGSATFARLGRSIAMAGRRPWRSLRLPVTGLIGWLLLAWARRQDRDLLRRILAVTAPALVATAASALADPHRAGRAGPGRRRRDRLDLGSRPLGAEFQEHRRAHLRDRGSGRARPRRGRSRRKQLLPGQEENATRAGGG